MNDDDESLLSDGRPLPYLDAVAAYLSPDPRLGGAFKPLLRSVMEIIEDAGFEILPNDVVLDAFNQIGDCICFGLAGEPGIARQDVLIDKLNAVLERRHQREVSSEDRVESADEGGGDSPSG